MYHIPLTFSPTVKRPGEDGEFGEFKRPKVEVNSPEMRVEAKNQLLVW